jgi:hypothetical protein
VTSTGILSRLQGRATFGRSDPPFIRNPREFVHIIITYEREAVTTKSNCGSALQQLKFWLMGLK